MMRSHFLQHYRQAFSTILGGFTFEAAVLFMLYNQLIRDSGVAGHVLEIGVYHGLSAIGVAALRGPFHRFVAIDLFENQQELNISQSGPGSQKAFLDNMGKFYESLDFVEIIVGPSANVQPAQLGQGFSFCHIDGGHSSAEAYQDLMLCSEVLMPGGLLALDDYFNPEFPGVCEGAVRFYLEHPTALKPVAIGFSRALFQKPPAPCALSENFEAAFPAIPKSTSMLWDTQVNHFTRGLSPFIDLFNSTPKSLVHQEYPTTIAEIIPFTSQLKAASNTEVALEVSVTNRSNEPFPVGHEIFGLSYHLRSIKGDMLKYNNGRAYLEQALHPGQTLPVLLPVSAPNEPGEYLLELDLVWENVCWFKDYGNPTAQLTLRVC